MAVVKQNCPGWDLCSNLWVCVPARAGIPGAGNAVNLCVPTRFVFLCQCCWNSKSTQGVLAEEFWTGRARGRAAGCNPCRTAHAVFVLSEKLFCTLTHRPRVWWVPPWWDAPDGSSALTVVCWSCCHCHHSVVSSQRDPNTRSLLSFAGMEGCRYSWEQQDTSTAFWDRREGDCL